jgi:hypothetical protein
VNIRSELNNLTTNPITVEVGPEINGTADPGGSATLLIDAAQTFLTDGVVKVGETIVNVTDGSSAEITAIADGQLTTTALSGGTANTWAAGDDYGVRSEETAGLSTAT